MAGILYAFRQERNMKIHGIAAGMAIILACLLQISRGEWGLLLIAIFMVIVTETINTAIENAVNIQMEEYHPLAKAAKDMAAGAVLLSAVLAVFLAFIIFGPYFAGLIGGG